MIDRVGAPRDGLIHGERVDRKAEQLALRAVTSAVTHSTPNKKYGRPEDSQPQDSQV